MGVIWDERLITRHRAADMAGTWNIKVDYAGPHTAYLRCAQCDGNITLLPTAGKIINVDGMISAVVRHMAGNHGYSLSGSGLNE